MNLAHAAKKIFLTLAVVTALALVPIALREAEAQTDQPWGGMIVYTMPCTCVPNVTWVLVMNYRTGGAFDYVDGTQMYRNRSMPLTTWAYGLYWSSGPACWMGVTPYCYMISSYGMISYVTGSS